MKTLRNTMRWTVMIQLSLLIPLFTLTAQEKKISLDYERFILPNGLNVILHEDHTTPTVSVNMVYFVGSGHERVGRTGFAHLFEHLMWEGSTNVPEGKFDEWLEGAGGSNNGSTNTDRTNYFDDIPSNALELALFLESDRLGYLVEGMTPDVVDGQRDVVKNERRQSYENRPYGMAWIELVENLYPPGHPYSWPTIGYMEDLSAASFEDVIAFNRKYYVPNNVSLAIAGDIDLEKTKTLVAKWFSEIPPGEAVSQIDFVPAQLSEEKRKTIEDDVQLPRLYMTWLTPAFYNPGDAELDVLGDILANEKNSRLYKRLVYDLQIAQDVTAFQWSRQFSSQFVLYVTARPDVSLKELESVIQEELDRIKTETPTEREVQRVVNQIEAGFFRNLERVGGFSGKAAAMNEYFFRTGNPDYFNEDLYRYKSLSPNDIQAIAATYLKDDGRFILSIVPQTEQSAE
ncbi:MAG: pitrilysin family protein [Candidatus Neomarinimicrobiota bacterium]